MSRHHHHHEGSAAHHEHGATATRADPTTSLLATVREPADLAAVLRAHAGHRDALVRAAQQRFGNGFVAEAMPLVGLTDAQARTAAPAQLATSELQGHVGGRTGQIDNNETPAANPAAALRLPFNAAGWDATTLLTSLGQRDSIAKTDSDGKRCVQAVALASHIVRGPAQTIAYLEHMLGDAGHGASHPTPRQLSARAVLARVCDRLRDKAATYEDLSWAQEALHDLTTADGLGTTGTATIGEVAPASTSASQPIDRWCQSPRDVLEAASALQDGEQMMATEWHIMWNNEITRANLNAQYKDPDAAEVHDVDTGRGHHHHWVHQEDIIPGQRPDPTHAAPGRDDIAGHQLLIVREHGELRLYDPESRRGGGHYMLLTAAALAKAFASDAAEQTYGYVKLDVKITPRA